ncbi:MAG: hypothetical protein U9R27_08195 [Campylobacterota bacterium]|nr:hypothetical protein [Campylobacterota bacterium]
MVKIIICICFMTLPLLGSQKLVKTTPFESECLSCHQSQSIPSERIYRRYLHKYSSKESIRRAMFSYIKNPDRENSIMPSQFFVKFPLKEPIDITDKILKRRIDDYIRYYDVNKRLFVP